MIRKLYENQDSREFTVKQLEQDLLYGFAAREIRKKIHQLARGRHREQDREDLRQEFVLHLFRRFKSFRPVRAHWNVYAKTLIERFAATLATKHKARQRQLDWNAASLDSLVCEHRKERILGELVADDRRGARLGVFQSTQVDQVDARLNADALLEELDAKGREICQRQMESSVSEVSREMKIPRTTLRRTLARLQKYFD